MGYTAVNTKIRAMGKRFGIKDLDRILLWLPDKPSRDLLTAMMFERERGITGYLLLRRALRYACKADRRALTSLAGMEADLCNIVWMYRLKKYYGVTGDATYGRLIPIRYRLTEEMTRRMVSAKDEEGLLAIVSQGPYAAVFPSFERPERLMHQALVKQYNKQARLHPNTLAPVCAYLYEARMRAVSW